MIHNLSFHPTLAGSLKSNINVESWDKVQNDYHRDAYADTIRNCINYINPEIEKKFANTERTEYNVPHGSIIVNIIITDKELIISAPFLDITNAKKIPVLRQVAQLNFAPLMLSHIHLEDDKLYFRFSCALELCEPFKIYEVLSEICLKADNFDDEFIIKFNAARIQEPKIKYYTTEETETAWNTVQQYIREAFDGYELLENKRQNNYLWDILVITLLKIDYFCSPQGNLRNEIEKAIIYLNSKDDYYQKLSGGKEFLKKLQNADKTNFEKDLYRIETFVPYKFRTTLETVRNNFKNAYEASEAEMKAKDFTGALFTMEYAILNFWYSNHMDDVLTGILTNAMKDASAKPVHEAAEILFNALKKIMTTDNFTTSTSAPKKNQPENEKTEKKGFFSKIFG